MEILRTPTHQKARKFLKKVLGEDKTILIVGACEVDYQGRAGSILPEGERVIIIKPDGTLLVHQKEKREPVNWNPPGCEAKTQMEDKKLQIISKRSSPEEILLVVFQDVMFAAAFELEDEEELQLMGTEEDLVRSVVQNPNQVEEGFQVKEKNKKIKTGEVDLYGEDSEGRGVIIEFKRGKATSSAVWQLGRYVNELEKKLEKEIRGIVSAPNITSGAKKILDEQNLEFIRVEEIPTRSYEDVVYDKNQKQIQEFSNKKQENSEGSN